jgi:hypothetical protein
MLALLQKILNTPSLLKQTNSTMVAFLQKQGNPSSQGSGNKVTDQEACFAELLQSANYTFVPKHGQSINDNYYRYQPNGTQKCIDFEVYDKGLNKIFRFDLKHTNSKTFYFNDGWFENGVIYIISWSPKKDINKVLIGYGEHIPTKKDIELITNAIQQKREMNELSDVGDSLRIYHRFANQYSCNNFTEEFTKDQFNRVAASLLV